MAILEYWRFSKVLPQVHLKLVEDEKDPTNDNLHAVVDYEIVKEGIGSSQIINLGAPEQARGTARFESLLHGLYDTSRIGMGGFLLVKGGADLVVGFTESDWPRVLTGIAEGVGGVSTGSWGLADFSRDYDVYAEIRQLVTHYTRKGFTSLKATNTEELNS